MPPPTAILQPADWTTCLQPDELFGNTAPLDVDIGCGKGRFLCAHATAHPERNVLGIDRQFKRLRPTDRKVTRAGLRNVRLIRIEASYAVLYLIPPESVATYFVFFPDPWPKRRHHRRRLFFPFLDALWRSLRPGGIIHVATDHLDYIKEVRGLFALDQRYRETDPFLPPEEARTEFELMFTGQGLSIGRQSFVRL